MRVTGTARLSTLPSTLPMHTHTPTPVSAPRKGLLAMSDDIIHSILCQIPDPRTLSIVAMTCKGLRKHVHGGNSKGILRAVTANASGSPACLEPALRAIRVRKVLEDSPKRATSDIVALDALKEDIILQEALEPWVLAALDDRLAVGRALEVVYSRSCKDRATRRNSLLLPSESDLFQPALHRAWLVSSLYSHDVLYVARGNPTWRTGTTCNRLLLAGLPAAQLAAFATIWRWMASVLYDPGPPNRSLPGRVKCAVLERGPRGILQLLESHEYEAVRCNILRQDGDRRHLDALLSECDALLPEALRAPDPRLGPDTAIFTRGVVSTVIGADDFCSKCKEQAGLALWNAENASSPPRDLQRSTLARHFNGMLKHIKGDEEKLASLLELIEGSELERLERSGEAFSPAAGVDIAIGRVIREIFQMNHAGSLVKSAPDEHVTPLLCATCLGRLLDRWLPRWWCIRTDTGSQGSRKRDCWHGIDCRKLFLNENHRHSYNHACRPSQEYAVFKAERRAEKAERLAKKHAALAQAASLKHSLDDDDLVGPAATADKS